MYLRDYSWAAGGFYPTREKEARATLEDCMSDPSPRIDGTPLFVGGIVPHAGWVFSGPTAGKVFKALSTGRKPPRLAVCFGSVHVYGVSKASALVEGEWRTPLGNLKIDDAAADKVFAALGSEIVVNVGPHEEEHSLEVVFPFLKKIFPDVAILPIMVPPDSRAAEVGENIAKALLDEKDSTIFVGSSDFTHYGKRFGFEPAGVGAKAVKWVKEENDAPLIEKITSMKSEEIVEEARRRQSACGAGAIAATTAAAKAFGAARGYLLGHTTSYDVMPTEGAETFVAYAGILF